VRRANHVIADSQATADDLNTLYNVPRERISVILSGVDARFRPDASAGNEDQLLRAKYGIGNAPFILAVGTLQRRKNHLGLVRAFATLRDTAVHLVIAGGKGWLYDDVLAEIRAARLTDRVTFTGFVDDADLPALYRAARVLAFPSFYEGFGLPPLEAMASGTPVVSANTSSLPEVVGDAALTVDPHDVAALGAALARALADGAWRRDAIARGLARASTFTWRRAAEQLISVYDRVLALR
jgi:glycosyltransferase involved in cell wall biosynthesis